MNIYIGLHVRISFSLSLSLPPLLSDQKRKGSKRLCMKIINSESEYMFCTFGLYRLAIAPTDIHAHC